MEEKNDVIQYTHIGAQYLFASCRQADQQYCCVRLSWSYPLVPTMDTVDALHGAQPTTFPLP